jgi:hypothetical protein
MQRRQRFLQKLLPGLIDVVAAREAAIAPVMTRTTTD